MQANVGRAQTRSRSGGQEIQSRLKGSNRPEVTNNFKGQLGTGVLGLAPLPVGVMNLSLR
jgi:hypothetical protein